MISAVANAAMMPVPVKQPNRFVVRMHPPRLQRNLVAYNYLTFLSLLLYILPISRLMAGTAVSSIFAIMFIAVTGNTLVRRTLVHAITMTFGAAYLRMFSHQRETCIVMVKGRVAPIAGIVT
jgi:hypothetical protein